MPISNINGGSPREYYLFGVLDGSNVDPKPSPKPASAQPGKWKLVDLALESLIKYGIVETQDGRIRFEALSVALKDPTLDHKSVDPVIKEDLAEHAATTLFGEVRADGKFYPDQWVDPGKAKVVIIVRDNMKSMPVAGVVISHEVMHANDILSGELRKIHKESELLVNASNGPAEQKILIGRKIIHLISETRAYVYQLGWALSHSTAYPKDKADMNFVIVDSVNQLNEFFGYKRYLAEQNILAVEGTPRLFNSLVDSLFEREVPSSGLIELNRSLGSYKTSINRDHVNSAALNNEIDRGIVPQAR